MKRTQLPMPKRPFRDSAIIYAVFAVLYIVIVGATGGALLPRIDHRSDHTRHVVIGGLPLALGCFVLATGYAW